MVGLQEARPLKKTDSPSPEAISCPLLLSWGLRSPSSSSLLECWVAWSCAGLVKPNSHRVPWACQEAQRLFLFSPLWLLPHTVFPSPLPQCPSAFGRSMIKIFSFDCVFYSPLFFVFDQLWISALTTTSPLPQYTHWLDKDISLISENYTSLRVERYKFVCCFDTVSRLFPCPNVPYLLWIEHLLTGMSLCLYGMESRLLGVAQKW